MFKVVFGDSTGFNTVTGLSVVVSVLLELLPGFIPGSDVGGGPRVLIGVRTALFTGFSTVVFSTASSFTE